MVRGRRVRAVMTCTRNDDCCSPNPKRKDQKLLNGKLAHAVLTPTNKTHTITEFFQAVTVDIDDKNLVKNENITIPNDIKPIRNSRRKNASPTKLVLNFEKSSENVTETIVPTTPVIVRKNNVDNDIVTKPSTPHRIELFSDSVEDIQKEPIIAKPILPAPKAKKRLNNGAALNHEIKCPEKDNHKLTEYFPVRRSVRKTEKTVLEEKKRSLEKALRDEVEEGLEVRIFEGKGRGVVAAKNFGRGDFVVEYSGDLIDPVEAKEREEKYAQDKNAGCYMYYFKHNDQQYCIDATAESGKLGRLVNHSRNGNLVTRTILVDKKPRLVLIAKDDIKMGEEVMYDYGDRSRESLRHHPWLAY